MFTHRTRMCRALTKASIIGITHHKPRGAFSYPDNYVNSSAKHVTECTHWPSLIYSSMPPKIRRGCQRESGEQAWLLWLISNSVAYSKFSAGTSPKTRFKQKDTPSTLISAKREFTHEGVKHPKNSFQWKMRRSSKTHNPAAYRAAERAHAWAWTFLELESLRTIQRNAQLLNSAFLKRSPKTLHRVRSNV